MKLTNRIREYIKCPQLNGTDYGRWGALTWEQRKLINELCEKCDMFENSADSFAKRNDILKAFIKTHHPQIAKINDITLDVVVRATDEKLEQENKQLKEELAIREKALKNSCIKITELDFILNGIIHNDKYWRKKFIEQAKESLDEERKS